MKTFRVFVPVAVVAVAAALWSGLGSSAQEGRGVVQAAPLPKWEYKVSPPWNSSAAEAEYNKLGNEGWELVGLTDTRVVFKRAKK